MNSVTQDTVFVGLDYHHRSIQACVMDRKGAILLNRRCENAVSEVADAIRACGAPARVAIESCAGAADLAEELIVSTGWPVSLAHPGYVARMKRGPDKTDRGDARILADLARVGYLPEVWLAPKAVQEMRILVRYRKDQVDRRTEVKLRLLAFIRQQRIAELGSGSRWTKKWMRWFREHAPLSPAARWVVDEHLAELDHLTARIERAEARLKVLTADDPIVAKLQEHPGIGPLTAWAMRALIGRFDRFRNGKQLARFCAVTPRNSSSGERVADSGLVKAGDPLLKTVVVQAAQRLARYEPRWMAFAARLRESGKRPCVIIGAIANRWMRRLHHEMKEIVPATNAIA